MRKNLLEKMRYLLMGLAALFALSLSCTGYCGTAAKAEKGGPPELALTVHPPGGSEEAVKVWQEVSLAILEKNGVEAYGWRYQGEPVIDILVADNKDEVYRVKTLLRLNGLLIPGARIDEQRVCDRPDRYEIEFNVTLDDYTSEKRAEWSMDVVDLLAVSGYEVTGGGDWDEPVVHEVPYPPFREAEKICRLIRVNGPKAPSEYRVFEEDPTTYSPKKHLLSIENQAESILIGGSVPLKMFDPKIYDRPTSFLFTVVDPDGKLHASRFRREWAGKFQALYPGDFHPTPGSLRMGSYQLRIYLDDGKTWDTAFTVDHQFRCRWVIEPRETRLVYTHRMKEGREKRAGGNEFVTNDRGH